ncbi:MAG: hypothetical protein G01um101419_12 [Parcubacteria group bacterium Gr01-1014_19]|nr:MAG: hypothetical protein G01um101419_12 [Parcubacteria group bacterium Gr01-1014_19]
MCEYCYHEEDPVTLKLDNLCTLLNSLTLNGMMDWQVCSRPNDSLGRTATGFRLVKPLRIDGKDYWISVYRLRYPGHDEDSAQADLEISCLQDGNTENFHGYWCASFMHSLIKSVRGGEMDTKEGTPEIIGDKKEKRLKLLDKMIRPLDAVLKKERKKV